MMFKTETERTEWEQLDLKNPRLHSLILWLENYVQLNFGKELTLTEIFRSQEEFDALYAQTPPEQRPARSPHQDWHAVDIRSSVFTGSEIQKMISVLNTFKYKDGSKQVCVYHQIAGNVMHFHIQYS